MSFTSFYMEKLKISNFLSFFGAQEVCMERFTAILCNYSEGKRDLLRALEFAFGASPKQIHAESVKHLVHKVLWKEFENESAVPCFVEFSLNLVSEKKSIKFYRGVKYSGIEHKIDERLVSNMHYEETLNNFNISINQKNIIFPKHLFYKVIWGNPEDLEKTVAEILRASYNLDEWKKAKERVKYLQETKAVLADQKYKNMKKSHETIEKFVDKFNDSVIKKDCFQESLKLEQILEEDSSLSVSSASKTPETPHETLYKELLHSFHFLEEEQDSLFERYTSLEQREKLLFCQLFYNEVRISAKPANASILQERIIKLKANLREHESYLPSLWTKMKEMDNQLEDLGRKISNNLGHLWDIQQSFYLKNRFTTYGRFIDYLQPNNFVNALRKILGEEIIYGNLCDDMETAVFYLNFLKGIKYGRRETFLIFKHYSSKLKDLILGSGEDGIRINNIQELQIFLCKLKQYGLISTVPVIISRRCNFKLEEGKNYDEDILYPLDGVFLKSDGPIIYTSDDKANWETEESLLERLNVLLIDEAVMYEEYRYLIYNKFETLRNIEDLENDILHLKFELKKNKPSRFVELEKRLMPEVYDSYATLFREHDQQIEDLERELEEFEDYSYVEGQKTSKFVEDRDSSPLESLLNSLSAALEETQTEKMKAKKELLEVEKKLRLAYLTSHTVPVLSNTRLPIFKQPKMKSQFYYEKEFEALKLLMSKNAVEEFMGWKDWRKEVLESFIQDTREAESSLKASKAALERLTNSRKKVLSPFLEHCSLHLSSTLNLMMDTSLPFLDLRMNQSQDGLQLLTSFPERLVNIIDVTNLNTFLRLIAVICLFLEIAMFDKIPILFFDDIEEFLPRHRDDFGSILNETTLKRVVAPEGNPHFQVLMRIAQFFEFFIRKNTPGHSIRKNGNKSGVNGPAQFIYFTSGDLFHFSHHQLWIQSKILPDEYISEDCDSYSSLQEIYFK